MKQELEKKLFEKYPKIFQDKNKSFEYTAICWGINCDDGWYGLLDRLCSNLQFNIDNNNKEWVVINKRKKQLFEFTEQIIKLIPNIFDLKHKLLSLVFKQKNKLKKKYIFSGKYPQIIATQVKEKYGGLRFYIQGGTEKQYSIISFAEYLSYDICETCGSVNNVTQTEGWIKTLCEVCLNKIKKLDTIK